MLASPPARPRKLSTGTSALVRHVTIVAALLANVALLRFAPTLTGEGFTRPVRRRQLRRPRLPRRRQTGAVLDNRLPERTVMVLLIVVHFLVGVFVVGRTLLGVGAH